MRSPGHPRAVGLTAALFAAAAVVYGDAQAQQVEAPANVKPLLAKGACLSCHAVDHKVVGPAYTDVAAKCKGDAGATDRLTTKILKGGSGVWGAIPMPPATALDEAQARILATWVLAGAPAK